MRRNTIATYAALIAAALLLAPGKTKADDRFVHVCNVNVNQIFGAKVSEYNPPEFSIVSEVHPDKSFRKRCCDPLPLQTFLVAN